LLATPGWTDANDTFLVDLENDGFSHVAVKKLDKKSLINVAAAQSNRDRRNEIWANRSNE
jgi:hypothetical protein